MSDETLNAATHGFGLILSSVAALALVHTCGSAACILYAATLVLVYGFSTLSHLQTTRRFLYERLDKGFIFYLIAGTYTPLVLASPVGGYALLAVIWAAATIGFIAKAAYRYKGIWPYVALAWLPILANPALLDWTVPGSSGTIALVVLGGLAYMLGLIFFAQSHRRGFHPTWHMFVMLGSFLHFVAIYKL